MNIHIGFAFSKKIEVAGNYASDMEGAGIGRRLVLLKRDQSGLKIRDTDVIVMDVIVYRTDTLRRSRLDAQYTTRGKANVGKTALGKNGFTENETTPPVSTLGPAD